MNPKIIYETLSAQCARLFLADDYHLKKLIDDYVDAIDEFDKRKTYLFEIDDILQSTIPKRKQQVFDE